MTALILGFIVGFIVGGAFIYREIKLEIKKGQAIYIGDDEYRCSCVGGEK